MTYVISHSEYMYDGPYMSQFKGTWRELLEDLNAVTDENRDEEFEKDGKLCTIKDLTDAELEGLFNEANGDGQPWIMVWSVEEERTVLGEE